MRLSYVGITVFQFVADDDECAVERSPTSPLCSQWCVNLPGKYKCDCLPGYMLEPDHVSCKATGRPTVKFFQKLSPCLV